MLIFVNAEEDIVKNYSYLLSKYTGVGFKLPKYISTDHLYRIQYESREARIVAWYLYHGDIEEFSLERKRQQYCQMILPNSLTPIDQFFDCFLGKTKTVPVIENDGVYIPLALGNNTDSLSVCKSIQTICAKFNIVCQPIFKNKGYYKYYVPYFPNQSLLNINMLRPYYRVKE
jgi:hypothetical protein